MVKLTRFNKTSPSLQEGTLSSIEDILDSRLNESSLALEFKEVSYEERTRAPLQKRNS